MISRFLSNDRVRGAYNAAMILARLARYGSVTSFHALRVRENEVELRKYLTKTVSHDCGSAVRALGFDVKVVGYNEELMKSKNFLMVGNHMSYFDILILAGVQPALFVTSVDMGQTPLLGQITKLAGCIFVERRHRGQIERDLHNMTDALKDGFNVMIYPEGTSSNGMQVLPFKKSLLMAAVEAERDILPVVLKYVEIDGKPFGPDNADTICWYGDMDFGPHFINLMKVKSLKAELHFLDPIPVTKESTRHELAEKTYQAVRACYEKGLNLQPKPARESEATQTAAINAV